MWWAALAQLRPTHENLLSREERVRSRSYVRDDDRRRFVLGCTVLRQVAADALGTDPAAIRIDRRCDDCGRQHGRPSVVGAPWDVSLSHSGEHVVVAVSRTRIGVDVEQQSSVLDVEALRDLILAPEERRHVHTSADLGATWVVKESALKATGEGLRASMDRVVVPPPGVDGLVRFLDAPSRTAWATVLAAPPGHRAALTAMTPGPLDLVTRLWTP